MSKKLLVISQDLLFFFLVFVIQHHFPNRQYSGIKFSSIHLGSKIFTYFIIIDWLYIFLNIRLIHKSIVLQQMMLGILRVFANTQITVNIISLKTLLLFESSIFIIWREELFHCFKLILHLADRYKCLDFSLKRILELKFIFLSFYSHMFDHKSLHLWISFSLRFILQVSSTFSWTK